MKTPKTVKVEYIESGTFQGGEEDVFCAKIKRGEKCVLLPLTEWVKLLARLEAAEDAAWEYSELCK